MVVYLLDGTALVVNSGTLLHLDTCPDGPDANNEQDVADPWVRD
jgi:hypothetical protein